MKESELAVLRIICCDGWIMGEPVLLACSWSMKMHGGGHGDVEGICTSGVLPNSGIGSISLLAVCREDGQAEEVQEVPQEIDSTTQRWAGWEWDPPLGWSSTDNMAILEGRRMTG